MRRRSTVGYMNRYQKIYESYSDACEDAALYEQVMYRSGEGHYISPNWARVENSIQVTYAIHRMVNWIFIVQVVFCIAVFIKFL